MSLVASFKSMIWTSFVVHIKLLRMVTNSSPRDNWSHCSPHQITVASLTMLEPWWVSIKHWCAVSRYVCCYYFFPTFPNLWYSPLIRHFIHLDLEASGKEVKVCQYGHRSISRSTTRQKEEEYGCVIIESHYINPANHSVPFYHIFPSPLSFPLYLFSLSISLSPLDVCNCSINACWTSIQISSLEIRVSSNEAETFFIFDVRQHSL